jgi:hypothetical protein
MFRDCALIFLLGFSISPAFATAGPAPMRMRPMVVALDLDASGKASNFQCVPPMSDGVCAVLTKAAAKWQFSPGITENVATPMSIKILLALEGTKRDGGYELHAIGATVSQTDGGAIVTVKPAPTLTPPRYPAHENRRGVVGNVVLELWPNPVTRQSKVRNAWFNGKPAGDRNALVAAAIKAAETWSLELPPGTLSVCIPIGFSLNAAAPPGDLTPCAPTYVEGYAPPKLLTKLEDLLL